MLCHQNRQRASDAFDMCDVNRTSHMNIKVTILAKQAAYVGLSKEITMLKSF